MAKENSRAQMLAANQADIPQDQQFASGLGNDLTPNSIYKRLVEQCRAEWEYCYRTQNSKVQVWLNRLKLYNNQKRDNDAVGDPLLFTVHNSVVASLYDDALTAKFEAEYDGGEDVAANLNAMAKFDKPRMKLDILRYFQWWDTCFFGKSFISMMEFNRKLMLPVPKLLDPTCFQQDPEAYALNGDFNGDQPARFLGSDFLATKYQLQKFKNTFDLEYLKLGKSTRSLIDTARYTREDAQGLNQQIITEEKDLGVNAYYQLTAWMTHFKDKRLTGDQTKKVLVWLGNDRQKVVRFKILPQQDKWPIIERSLFPSAHDFYGTSVTDLVEDKQRMKAVLLNLGINQLKKDLFGRYLYDRNHIKSRGDLNYDFNKHIGVDLSKGENIGNIVQPINTQNVNQQYFQMIMNILEGTAEKAAFTSDNQQGGLSQDKRTLGELNKKDQGVSQRMGLVASIAGWSETEFWEQYYYLYDKYFKSGIDQKMVKVQSIFAADYPKFEREDIIGDLPPSVKIVSEYKSQAEKAKNRQLLAAYGQVIIQEPTANKRWFFKKIGKANDLTEDDLEQLFPPTPDEIEARRENILLSQNKYVPVKPEQNHEQHLEQHAKADKTKQLLAHKLAHEYAMELKKTRPDLFPTQGQQPGQPSSPQNGQQPNQQLNQALQNQTPTRNQQATGQGEQSGLQLQ